MPEIQLAHFSWGETPGHSRVHAIALHDARAASERRASEAPAPRTGIAARLGLARVRLALAGGPGREADACGCAA